MLKESSRGDNLGLTVRAQRKQMCMISGDEELGLSGDRAFEDAVIIIFVGDCAFWTIVITESGAK